MASWKWNFKTGHSEFSTRVCLCVRPLRPLPFLKKLLVCCALQPNQRAPTDTTVRSWLEEQNGAGFFFLWWQLWPLDETMNLLKKLGCPIWNRLKLCRSVILKVWSPDRQQQQRPLKLGEVQVLGLCCRPAESESPRVEPRNCVEQAFSVIPLHTEVWEPRVPENWVGVPRAGCFPPSRPPCPANSWLCYGNLMFSQPCVAS